ncbi:uncharacterized protein LODBEIA_P46420 [Lodderomyces beijingensis]|uniref:C2H2-type domain-containing protein n=1 Tax=Lodderomyces beijingensis TaxID=1775926 RepID=A0ABP0ZQJ1_9ASCO
MLSLSHYSLNHQQHHPQVPMSPITSPKPAVVQLTDIEQQSQYLHQQHQQAAVTLPSIHSLNIPSFPPLEKNYTLQHHRGNFAHVSHSVSPQQPFPSLQASVTTPSPALAPLYHSHSLSSHSHLEHEDGGGGAAATTGAANEDEEEEEIGTHESTVPSPSTSPFPDQRKNPTWKPRKKRQCPECKLHFSNLATHKSTHLNPTNRPHICEYCQRGFARPNDLFRHTKCHWKEIGSDKGQFKCPFKSEGASKDADHHHQQQQQCCHNTGMFSRCDTFKNHLKAIHFQYPNGTKKESRSKVKGRCRSCQMEFDNVDIWLKSHIDTKQCNRMVFHE